MFIVDRVQFSSKLNTLLIYEFHKVDNISNLKQLDGLDILESLVERSNEVFRKKVEWLMSLNDKICIFFILYTNISEDIIILQYKGSTYVNYAISSFLKVAEWFRSCNNIDGIGYSKELGAVRDENKDVYVNNIIAELYNLKSYEDDCGLEITKQMLENNATRGFDLDLCTKISNTNETLIFEFLKRDNNYVTNITAHPMRYCWTGTFRDNKKKFIGLWKAKENLNARLFLVNYSDNEKEDISISEILELSEEVGILEENKYVMSITVFKQWLKDIRNNNITDDIFRYFQGKHYDNEFFKKWFINKKIYGK